MGGGGGVAVLKQTDCGADRQRRRAYLFIWANISTRTTSLLQSQS